MSWLLTSTVTPRAVDVTWPAGTLRLGPDWQWRRLWLGGAFWMEDDPTLAELKVAQVRPSTLAELHRWQRRNRLGDGLDEMKFYKENSVKMPGADPSDPALDLGMRQPIAVGKFVDIDKPTYLDQMNDYYQSKFGDAYTRYGG